MIKAVRIGFVIAAGLLLGLLPSPAHAEESALSLDISASKSQYANQSPEAKRFVVSRSDNGTGEYSFRVVTHKHRRFDVKMGDQIGGNGVPGTGRLDVPGRVDSYALDAAGASSIRIVDHRACDYWVGIAEDGPDTSVPTPYPVWSGLPDVPDGACGTLPIHIEPDKRFLLVVWSVETKTFDYEFRIEPV